MVKICGITRREDAEAAVDAGASAIGFIFYPQSPRYVEPARAAELGAGLSTLKVGIFVNESPAHVEAVARAANLDIVQLYGGESPAGLRVWRAFRINEGVDWSVKADAILLDGPRNGVSPIDWSDHNQMYRAVGGLMVPYEVVLVKKVWFPPAGAPPVIVAGGLDATTVGPAIRTLRPWGVDVSSKLESAPGIKDHAKIREFINAANAAAATI